MKCAVTLLGLILAGNLALAQELAPRDADGDGLVGAADPEPDLSNLAERFVYRLESPTLTWKLDQEQFNQVEKTTEQLESTIELARQAAVEALSDSSEEATLAISELAQAEPGWMQLSINPLAMFESFTSGTGPLDALASGLRFGAEDERERTDTQRRESSILKRLVREETRSREELAERRTRLLQIQRFTRVLRDPTLHISLHLRNGGSEPLVIVRPEVPVLAGQRMLGVALPIDARDRDRVTIPPGRSQAILLAVAVDDTDFWDALTRGGDQIRYEPLLGAMRAHFASQPDVDLLSLQRDASTRCVPARIYLPEGAVVEQSLARVGVEGEPVTVREAIAAWNQAWRRTHPELDADLIHVDSAGQVVAAAGRMSSPLASGWQVVVDGKALQPGDSTDVAVSRGIELRWTDLRAAFEPIARRFEGVELPQVDSAWVLAGVTAWREHQRLRGSSDATAVIASIELQLQGKLGELVPEEYRGALLTTLGEAQRFMGDAKSARENWEKAARHGDPQAILALANQLFELPGAFDQAVDRLRQAVAAGSSEAMVRLAEVEQQAGGDRRRALLLIGQAAEAGFAPALVTLGQRYASGDGLPADSALAASLYRAAAEGGDTAAMLRLGMMYETGQGLPRDAARASLWYRAAASGTPWKEGRP